MVTNTSAAWGFRDLAHEEFSLLKEFSHPESRQKGVDLLSDRPGQGSAKGGDTVHLFHLITASKLKPNGLRINWRAGWTINVSKIVVIK
ncbi:MAG: hypothetical protein ACJAYB_003219 [Psychromonas sp.]|jgi:hypothetical protein